jgi:signal transduction histidine kinase
MQSPTARPQPVGPAYPVPEPSAQEPGAARELARQRWWRAVTVVTRHLLAADAADTLDVIAECGRRAAAADAVVVLRMDDRDGGLDVAATPGPPSGTPDLLGPADLRLCAQVLRTGRAVRLARRAGAADRDGPLMAVPLRGDERIGAVLVAVRVPGGSAFTADDLEMAAGFARQAAVAVELATARAAQQRAAVHDERDRIAADLYRDVVHRLFGIGLSLQGVAAAVGPGGPVAPRIREEITHLDATIDRLRRTVFRLRDRGPGACGPDGVGDRLREVVAQLEPALGFAPEARVSGSVEDHAGSEIARDVLTVVGEALGNVARHARAGSARIELCAGPDRLVLVVEDDGVGMPAVVRRSGLDYLRHRAERHGGALVVGPATPTGTRLVWTALV